MHFVRFSIVDKETNKDLVMKKARFMGWICLFMLITSVSLYGQATRLTFVSMNDAVNKTIMRNSGVRVYMVYGSGGWKLRGMTKPASNTSAFYLLHDSEFSVQAPVSMVLELPYNSFYTLIPSTVMISYNPQIQFQSIDAYYNNTQCVMNGYSIPNPLELMFYQQFASLGDICLYHSNEPYYNPGMSEKNNILPFNVTSFSPISFFTVNAQSAENTLGHTVCP